MKLQTVHDVIRWHVTLGAAGVTRPPAVLWVREPFSANSHRKTINFENWHILLLLPLQKVHHTNSRRILVVSPVSFYHRMLLCEGIKTMIGEPQRNSIAYILQPLSAGMKKVSVFFFFLKQTHYEMDWMVWLYPNNCMPLKIKSGRCVPQRHGSVF